MSREAARVTEGCPPRNLTLGRPWHGQVSFTFGLICMICVQGHIRVRAADIARLRGPLLRQITTVREFYGCDDYAFGIDVRQPDLLHVSERWRTREAQSAHLIGDHMVEFNIAMRAAQIVEARVDCHDGSTVRRLMDFPTGSFRGERMEADMVVVMGTAKLAPGDIERLGPEIAAMLDATRAEEGCVFYTFSRDIADPDLLRISERWRDRTALDAHFATAHMATFNAALTTATIAALDVRAWDADGERVLMAR